MQLNIDIEGMAAAALASALEPERVAAVLEKHMIEAVDSGIKEQFGYRSEFTKLLNAELARAMPTNVEDLGRFSDLVVKTVTEVVNAHQAEFVKKAVADRLNSMLRPLPETMKLSEVVQQIVATFDEHDRDGSSAPTVIFERSDTVGGYAELRIDPRGDRSRHGCRFRARLHPVDDDNHGLVVCWALEIDDEKLENKRFIGPTFNAEALLLNLYTGQVKIEIDETDFSEVYYPSEFDD